VSKKLVVKTIARTLVYQFLLLCAGFSLGFMLNAEYWGNRAPIVQRSMRHIFWPKQYDKNVEEFCMNIARSRIFVETSTDCPDFTDLRIIEDKMESDEWYSATYEYRNAEGKLIQVDNYTTKVNWKPWELHYPQPDEETMEGK
jgi:hypothetical protein